MKIILTFFFAILIFISPAIASTISGNIYDFSLEKVGNAVVEIDTAPKQFYVSKNGTYSFIVPIGSYEIKANKYDQGLLVSSTSENITIKEEGDFILDLVLFPEINEDELLEKPINISSENDSRWIIFYVVIISSFIFLIILGSIYYFKLSKVVKSSESGYPEVGNITWQSNIGEQNRTEEDKVTLLSELIERDKNNSILTEQTDSLLEEIIKIIKAEGGRTTQKDIRKKIPLSEAKISLAIAELESSKRIKKIKKGRGNIIILR